ncbi:hypothetical protein DVH05_013845 [Phytophthora capsici]|nr:hypothetical protein DVH05_013845 [Phytophthora capsici]
MSSTPPKELPVEGQEQPQSTEVEVQETAVQAQSLQEEQLDTKEEKKEEDEKKAETPAKSESVITKTPSQTSSATKRKFDVLHARNTKADPSISEHENNKKARASALMKTPGTNVNRSAKPATKVREFSFARPTQSSANRTAAAAKDHARAKPTPLSARNRALQKKIVIVILSILSITICDCVKVEQSQSYIVSPSYYGYFLGHSQRTAPAYYSANHRLATEPQRENRTRLAPFQLRRLSAIQGVVGGFVL